ncbi:MAG: hypothetical protein ACF8AM_08990 [Rhodopirellula sp. JB055]|uniref:hypothetical protein n=1 Tax=Rhodopirellula sp. JB055 TaxID=3342846 RepID=UPI00370CF134
MLEMAKVEREDLVAGFAKIQSCELICVQIHGESDDGHANASVGDRRVAASSPRLT